MAYVSEWAGAQPAYAAFHLGPLKNRSFQKLFFDIMITYNDHPRYVKHVVGRLGSIYMFVITLFGDWGGGYTMPRHLALPALHHYTKRMACQHPAPCPYYTS